MKLQKGQAIDPISYPEISREQLVQYKDASGDNNPIHVDEEVAKKMGLPGVIAHGMLIAALVAERVRSLQKDLEGEWTLKIFKSRFKAMTFPGEVISVSGSVRSVSEDAIELDLSAQNTEGEVKVSTQAVLEAGSFT